CGPISRGSREPAFAWPPPMQRAAIEHAFNQATQPVEPLGAPRCDGSEIQGHLRKAILIGAGMAARKSKPCQALQFLTTPRFCDVEWRMTSLLLAMAALLPVPQDPPPELRAVAFFGVECPLAKLYAQRLNELQAAFPQVRFEACAPNRQDNEEEVAEFQTIV